jgi:hypothetical protein
VWIVQEAVYGKDPVVVCGKHRFPWHLLQFFGELREIWNKITWMLLQQEKMFYSGKFVHASDRLDFICAVPASCPIGLAVAESLSLGSEGIGISGSSRQGFCDVEPSQRRVSAL